MMIKLGKYQHSKTGKYYRVIGVAKHSETLEDLVVYEALYDNPKSKLWVRSLKMFLEKVIIPSEIEGVEGATALSERSESKGS